MSREIKFRAWMENKMLSHEDLVDMDQEFYAMYTILTEPQEDIIFMQYTGLNDKNGKEIFEGDILAINNTRYVVSYREYSGGWQLEIKNEYCAEMVQGNCELLEIIGNVYEHKHLLEEAV